MQTNRRSLLILAAAVSVLCGCSRTLSVGSQPAAETYAINVQNETSVAMLVRYNDGRGDALLGSVAAGGAERFVIAAPASLTIHVRGTAVSGGQTAGPYTVTLAAGETVLVTLISGRD